jgi:hypothetical protein
LIVYKYVNIVDGNLVSVGDSNFIYRLSEFIQAEYKNEYSGIYCFYKHGVNGVAEDTKRDFVLIECLALNKHHIRDEGDKVCVFKAVKPLRIVSRDEYQNW